MKSFNFKTLCDNPSFCTLYDGNLSRNTYLTSNFSMNSQYDGLERLVKDSEMLQRAYKHLFDITIVNEDIDETLNELEHALETAHTTPQWVPVSWVY